jgi:hypothetical protein
VGLIGDRLLRMLLLTAENVFFRPDWWDGLEQSTRAALVAEWNYSTSLQAPVSPNYLSRLDGLPLHWELSGVRTTRGAG